MYIYCNYFHDYGHKPVYLHDHAHKPVYLHDHAHKPLLLQGREIFQQVQNAVLNSCFFLGGIVGGNGVQGLVDLQNCQRSSLGAAWLQDKIRHAGKVSCFLLSTIKRVASGQSTPYWQSLACCQASRQSTPYWQSLACCQASRQSTPYWQSLACCQALRQAVSGQIGYSWYNTTAKHTDKQRYWNIETEK